MTITDKPHGESSFGSEKPKTAETEETQTILEIAKERVGEAVYISALVTHRFIRVDDRVEVSILADHKIFVIDNRPSVIEGTHFNVVLFRTTDEEGRTLNIGAWDKNLEISLAIEDDSQEAEVA